MAMTAEAGRKIRKENSDIEILPCEMYGLTMVTDNKSKTKIDGFSDTVRASIKASRLSSTQVHITGVRAFSNTGFFSDESVSFIEKFFVKGDRPGISTFDNKDSMLADLNTNKEGIIGYILGVPEGINLVIWFDKDTNTAVDVSTDKIMQSIKNGEWVVGKKDGSFTFVLNGKSLFHLQRHTTFNPQFHIKRNVMSL